MERQITKIVWDVDNTLWDWVSYASVTYPSMCESISERIGVSRDEVAKCMQRYYTRARTVESSWLVQGLEQQGLFDAAKVDQGELIRELQKRFHATRSRSLNLYDGITRVLEIADDQGVDNHILSDAPAFHAASRIRHLNVDQSLFRSMHALEDSMQIMIPDYYKDKDKEHYGLAFPVHTLKHEKPHTDLESVLGMTREEIMRHVAIIGDNGAKDMELAARYGCVGIQARWGEPTPEQIEILKRFAPTRIMKKNLSVGAEFVRSTQIIRAREPRDILRVLGWE